MVARKRGGDFDSKDTIAARIPIREMIVAEYQGHVTQGLVNKLVAKWDESAAGAIILNLRDSGEYAVLDGQHRVLAARQKGVSELNALVFIGKTLEEEAKLFVQLNTKHNVRTIDKFRANMVAGQLTEKNIVVALREVGLTVGVTGPKPDGTSIQCPGVLVRIYEAHGLSHFKMVAGILTSAFKTYDDRGKGYLAPFWEAVSQMVFRYPNLNVGRLIQKMYEKSPTTWMGMGTQRVDIGQDIWMGLGKALTAFYNMGIRPSSETFLPVDRWLQKKYTPKALKSISSPEVTAKRMISLEKARKANVAANYGWDKRRAKKAEMTVGVQPPLKEDLKAAAKTTIK